MSPRVRIAFLASWLFALPAGAEAAQRTFVASTGLDTNPCSRVAPCRSFTSAVAQTDPAGEVIVLDSAGYGPVTIAKPVSIIGPPGVYAGISVPSGTEGVIIDHPTARVVLRGLTLNGTGGLRGIDFINGLELHVDGCTVSGMASDGIRLQQSPSVTIRDTLVRGNNGNGIYVDMSGGLVTMERVRSERNALSGVLIVGGTVSIRESALVQNDTRGLAIDLTAAVAVDVTIAQSGATGNASHGVLANANQPGSAIRISVVGNVIAQNGFGAAVRGVASTDAFMLAEGNDISRNALDGLTVDSVGATLAATGNTITRNGNGLVIQGGTLRTRGDNTITDNITNNVVGSPPPPLPGV